MCVQLVINPSIYLLKRILIKRATSLMLASITFFLTDLFQVMDTYFRTLRYENPLTPGCNSFKSSEMSLYVFPDKSIALTLSAHTAVWLYIFFQASAKKPGESVKHVFYL